MQLLAEKGLRMSNRKETRRKAPVRRPTEENTRAERNDMG